MGPAADGKPHTIELAHVGHERPEVRKIVVATPPRTVRRSKYGTNRRTGVYGIVSF